MTRRHSPAWEQARAARAARRWDRHHGVATGRHGTPSRYSVAVWRGERTLYQAAMRAGTIDDRRLPTNARRPA